MASRVLIGSTASAALLLGAAVIGVAGSWAAVMGLLFMVLSAFTTAILTDETSEPMAVILRNEVGVLRNDLGSTRRLG